MLIVDDDSDTREMYREALRAYGFEPETASSGAEAMQAARASTPAVVITDLRLKGDVDGLALCRSLRANSRTKDVRIIVLTGATFGGEREQAERSGCDRFLVKPCLPDQLASEIRRLTVEGVSPRTLGANLKPERVRGLPARKDRRKV